MRIQGHPQPQRDGSPAEVPAVAGTPGSLPPEVAGWRAGPRLGAGASGAAVWRAVDGAGRVAALKLLALPAEGAAPAWQDALRRFEQEGAVAERLSHPHIVGHLGHGRDRGFAWLALEYLGGGDLAACMAGSGALAPADAAPLAGALLGALAHAHEQGVVHRDLKPANVLRGERADDWRVADFGVARVPTGLATRSGALVGTPAYMAPEALAGVDAGARGDLYAVGVLLYEALAGRLPFEGRSMGALLRDVASGTVTPLVQRCPGVGPAWSDWVAVLMARDPSRRPVSARAALAAMPASGGAA